MEDLACVSATRNYPGGRTGTVAGYQAHLKARDGICEPCKLANRNRSSQLNSVRGDYRRDHYRRNREAYSDTNRLRKHNVTRERYDALLAEQGGRCAICRTDQPGGRGRLCFYVDHDHACCPGSRGCGKCVRALLCAQCNVGIGALGDDPERLREAARYLERHRDQRRRPVADSQSG